MIILPYCNKIIIEKKHFGVVFGKITMPQKSSIQKSIIFIFEYDACKKQFFCRINGRFSHKRLIHSALFTPGFDLLEEFSHFRPGVRVRLFQDH